MWLSHINSLHVLTCCCCLSYKNNSSILVLAHLVIPLLLYLLFENTNHILKIGGIILELEVSIRAQLSYGGIYF